MAVPPTGPRRASRPALVEGAGRGGSANGGSGRTAERRAHADTRIFYVFLLLLAWAPIPLGSNRPWASAMLEIGLFAVAAVCLWLYAFGKIRLHTPFRNAWPALLLFGAWLLLLLFQVVPLPVSLIQLVSPVRAAAPGLEPQSALSTLSVAPYTSEGFLLQSIAYVLAFALTLVFGRTRSRLRIIAYAILGCALFQSLLSSFLHLSGLDFEIFFTRFNHSAAASGTFVNRNHLAGYLEMSLALGIGMMIATLRGGESRSWKQWLRGIVKWMLSTRVLLRVSLIIMVVALVMTRSRMGNAAFFSSMLIAGVIGLLTSKYATRSTIILLVSLIVIDVFIVGTWFGVENLVKRYEDTTLYRVEPAVRGPEGSVEERIEPGLYALDMIRDYPAVGGGGGTFYVTFPKYRPEAITAYFDFAHNDYVQFATETGLLGLGILGLVILATLFVALRVMVRRRDPLARGVAFGVIMGIVAIMIHSWVDFNLQIPANALTFVVLLALGWIAHSLDRRHPAEAAEQEGRGLDDNQEEFEYS